ncbi:unnamed protein product, partial [marine sediment metagenome]
GSGGLILSVQNVYREEILDRDFNPIIDKQAIIIDLYMESIKPDGQLGSRAITMNYDNGDQHGIGNSQLSHEGYRLPNHERYIPNLGENWTGVYEGESIRGYLYYVIPKNAKNLYLTIPPLRDKGETITVDLENFAKEKYNPRQSLSAYVGKIGDSISNGWYKITVLNYQVKPRTNYLNLSNAYQLQIDLVIELIDLIEGEDTMSFYAYLQDKQGFTYKAEEGGSNSYFGSLAFDRWSEGDIRRGGVEFYDS